MPDDNGSTPSKTCFGKCTVHFNAVILFYLQIILEKLSMDDKSYFRKVERCLRLSVKCGAGINL